MAVQRLSRSSVHKIDRQGMFLRAIELLGSVITAAELAGIEPGQHYEWLKDKTYREAFQKHRDRYCEVVEAEAHRRAIVGWDEPVYQNGSMVGTVHKHSDPILALVMKGTMRAKYSERVESHNTNTNLDVAVPIDLSKLNDEELANIAELAAKVRGIAAAAGAASESGTTQPSAP